MNNKGTHSPVDEIIEARELVDKARESLRRGDKASARQIGEQAALLAPEMEDAWLILAASDPDPHEALAYAQKALELNPQSARARRGVEWASGRLKQVEGSKEPVTPRVMPNQVEAVSSLPKKQTYQTAVAMPQLNSNRRNWLLPALLAGAGCVVVGFLLFFALTSPALASIISVPAPTQENLWAPVDIVKPQVTPMDGNALAVQLEDTPASTAPTAPSFAPSVSASATSTRVPNSTPTPSEIPTEAPNATSAATETPGVMAMEVLADTPTSEYAQSAPTYSPQKEQYASSGNGVRWIDVNLSEQRVYAYEGDVIVNSFIVSTGTRQTPTVTGKFKIYIKLVSGSMRGPGYYLPDVPYIMYFHKSYGLHGTYWHSNFGTPMSHGCVNLSIGDAAWLYDWSYLGTVVNVHH